MFTDFYTAYQFLYTHPMFQEVINYNNDTYNESRFQECLDIDVVKVNPETNNIDDDENKNTKVQIWIECGKFDKDCRWHNIELDCGAATFELAIIELANLVMEWYGEGNERIKKADWERDNIIKNCPEDDNIRCINCSCYLCKNNCQECNVENCEPKEIIYK